MKAAWRIAAEEWRHWRRAWLLRAATALALLLLVTAMLTTAARVSQETTQRLALQQAAEAAFKAQPDRHPHRMVHYGHYAFRPPPPLAVIDPGVDAVTGSAIFLEGHRQNSAVFPPDHANPRQGAFGQLTPAFVYQVVLPLLLMLLGHNVFTRERAGGTDLQLLASGVSALTLWGGKALALLGAAAILLLPLLLLALGAALQGESLLLVLYFLAGHALYLALWALGALAVSTLAPQAATALLVAVGAWAALTLVAPPLLSSTVNAALPSISRLATDLDLARELREFGDGHNANDPAFSRLRASLLEQHQVDRVEDLPVNFRGLVAQTTEAEQTAVMNRHAERRYEHEQRQAQRLSLAGALSPRLALRQFSRISTGTDLGAHQRFLRQAEAARFKLVQQLNILHANELRYEDDINRSRDPAAECRTRVSASHWRTLDDFRFTTASAPTRMAEASPALGMLLAWCLLAALAGIAGARRAHG